MSDIIARYVDMETEESMMIRSVYYPKVTDMKLKKLGEASDRPISYLIRKAIDEYLERQEDE